jgi:uncharacterized protein YdeI (YjbR/CyaY-like superfamily)
MGKRDKKVDAYIARSAEFAWPILEHLRNLVHKACPDVDETIKWGFPHFEHKGVVCSMAAFKQHCSFGFWKASLLKDPYKVINIMGKTAMGSFERITSPKDLPSGKILLQYIKEAVALNEQEVKRPVKTTPKGSKTIEVPDYFTKALKRDKKAMATFDGFSYSNKKDYVEWVTEAKTEQTRDKRLATAVEWMAEGKTRHWKYQGNRYRI